MIVTDNPHTGFAVGALATLPSLADAPELYRQMPAADDSETRSNARRDQDFATRAAAGATALADRLRETQPEMAEGLAGEMLRRFDEESAALLDGAPSPAAEDAARAAVGRARGRFADRLLPEEAAARTVARRQGLIEALAGFRAAAERDPDAANALHAEGAAAIQGAQEWLGESEAHELEGQWTEELYFSAAKSMIAQEPQGALVLLSTETYRGSLAPQQRIALIEKAHRRMTNVSFDDMQKSNNEDRQNFIAQTQRQISFVNDFRGRIQEGTAYFAELSEASEKGIISSYEAERLQKQLNAQNALIRRENAAIARTKAFIDGDAEELPSAHDIATHYRAVMSPILATYAPEARGRLVVEYMQTFGRLKNVEPHSSAISLKSPTDEPVTREDIYKLAEYDPSGRGEYAEAVRYFPASWTVKRLSDMALKETENLFSGMPLANTAADAFRHAYWAYESARQTSPETARVLTNAHERDDGLEGERLMDLFNNSIGIKLAQLPENQDRDGKDVILGALLDGKLQMQPFKLK